ncbi:hypothetical protein HMPREF0183_0083 [Brevibacterium mcbrellneri ATCC 49030]|uniref:Uncharacterized protein n=1 Tax=Brevibacterium mcbrellneri ATCC 49030 TaxID=585530 RepID=D4YJH3_9MICO|nr:hypothetical protein [Brevibacterium mcbrellneri]EFG48668.1 hypothetical protein HMPREF0183_0083 [Brevibacterium mcbrellneri ATCC 49030]
MNKRPKTYIASILAVLGAVFIVLALWLTEFAWVLWVLAGLSFVAAIVVASRKSSDRTD